MISSPVQTPDIRSHYDKLSPLYKLFWGNHIHHGYWANPEISRIRRSSRSAAQVRLIEELARFANVRRGSLVLDIGCGLGGSSQWLARNLDCRVTGLTLSPVQARMATASVRRNGLQDRVTIQVQDANDVSFAEIFDTVWMIECSEHLHDKPAFIRKVRSMLKESGTFALCAWLVADHVVTPQERDLATRVCSGMLCPSLGSMPEYQDWLYAAGFGQIEFVDITRQVEHTWDLCAEIARRPAVKAILRSADRQTREFVEAFEAIRSAYATNVMRYGMFSATAV